MEIEKKKYWLLLYGLIIGIVFDILFYNKTLGISYPIFIFLIIAVLTLIFLKTYSSLEKKAWIWVIPVILLSITFSIYSNQILKILNFIIVLYLVIMFAACMSKLNRADWADLRFLADFFKRIFVPLKYIHMPFITFFRMTEGKEGKRGRIATRVALGLIISVPLLAVIIWLLSSADIIFKDIFLNIPVSKIIKHFFVILAVSVYAICFFWSILKSFDEEKKPAYLKMKWKKILDPVVLITIISLLNIVYTVFSVIQFTYLFWGESFVLPSSYTYAEYARRGFFELLAVSVINFIIILIAVSFIRKENRKVHLASKVLLSLLVGLTFVLLISAFYRMLIYEQAYGFTYRRIFVQAFMVLLFFLFIINIIYIWYAKLPIIKSYFVMTLMVYIILNFSNVDLIIARNNIDRYIETGQIDIEYLKGLSSDAICEMQRLINIDLKSESTSGVRRQDIKDEVLVFFNDKKIELDAQKHWQSFNISRYRASRIVYKYIK
ncbi:MAG: DUF4173 domain-containing protein [Actinobacteria bacterium]|nr:DUF4173 domain-containing protein [Actinomycetota bacterium]